MSQATNQILKLLNDQTTPKKFWQQFASYVWWMTQILADCFPSACRIFRTTFGSIWTIDFADMNWKTEKECRLNMLVRAYHRSWPSTGASWGNGILLPKEYMLYLFQYNLASISYPCAMQTFVRVLNTHFAYLLYKNTHKYLPCFSNFSLLTQHIFTPLYYTKFFYSCFLVHSIPMQHC